MNFVFQSWKAAFKFNSRPTQDQPILWCEFPPKYCRISFCDGNQCYPLHSNCPFSVLFLWLEKR